MPNIKQNAINPAVNEPLGQGILARATAAITADMVVKVVGQFGAHFEVAPVTDGIQPAGFNNLYVARHSASTDEYVVILPWKTIQVTRLSLDPNAKFPGAFPIVLAYVDPNTGLYTGDVGRIYDYYAGGEPLVLPVANVIDQGNPALPASERIVTLQVNPSGKINGVVELLFNATVTLPAGVTSLAWPMTGIPAETKGVITDNMVIVASVRKDDTGGSIGTLLSATLWPSAPGVYDTVQLRWEAAGVAGDAEVRLQCVYPML